MTNVMPNFGGFPAIRTNNYVPSMVCSADVNDNGLTRVNFGTVLAASGSGSILNNLVLPNDGVTKVDLSGVAPFVEPYGRTLFINGPPGSVTVYGWDYLGQPMANLITTAGGAGFGSKAFKALSYLVNSTGGPYTVSMSFTNRMGLPYKALRCEYEIGNGLIVNPGTFIASSTTDPQTAASADPRGTYSLVTAQNGVNIISAVFAFANDVNSAGNGGLYGLRHFAG